MYRGKSIVELREELEKGETTVEELFEKANFLAHNFQEEYNSLTGEGYMILDIVGRCESNSWGGRMTPQILIDDYEITNAV